MKKKLNKASADETPSKSSPREVGRILHKTGIAIEKLCVSSSASGASLSSSLSGEKVPITKQGFFPYKHFT